MELGTLICDNFCVISQDVNLNYCKRLLEVLSWLLNVAQQPKAIWTIPQSRLRAELADGHQGCKPQPKQPENVSDNS